jgi:hypothetical protein
MGRRETRLVLGGILGLLVAFASSSATAAIILADQFSSGRGGEIDSLSVFHGQVADDDAISPGRAGMATATSGPSLPSDNQTDPPTFHPGESLGPSGGTAGQPNSFSQGSGGGAMSAAASVLASFSEPPFQTALPGEARTIMPTGPPFELLRPPRGSA